MENTKNTIYIISTLSNGKFELSKYTNNIFMAGQVFDTYEKVESTYNFIKSL